MPLELPPIVQPPQFPNALQQFGQYAELANSINQNKLFQGRVEAGQLAQQAIDPQTGQIDGNKFAQLLQNDPRAAPYAQEALTSMLAQTGQGISNQTAQQALAAQRRNALNLYVGALPKGASGDDVASAAAMAVKQGITDPATAASFLSTLPADPAKVDAWRLNNATLPSLGSQGAFDQTHPAVTNINTGGQILPTQQSRIGEGDNPVAPPIATTLTPGENVARVSYVNPQTGQPGTASVASIATPTGQPKPLAGVTGPGGTLATGLQPGVSEALTATGTAYAQQAVGLTQRAAQVPANKALLGNMEGLLGNFDPGPQSHWWKTFGQLASEYGIAVPGAPPKDNVAAQEEFGKLSLQLAQSQFQSLGGTGTDSKLDSTMKTSPSEALSTLGNKGIIALLKGNEDAITAQSRAWQDYQAKTGATPDKYGQFLNNWTKVYDPRVFQSQYMDPDARQAMLKGMTAAEQQQFQRQYKYAYDKGWLQQ